MEWLENQVDEMSVPIMWMAHESVVVVEKLLGGEMQHLLGRA